MSLAKKKQNKTKQNKNKTYRTNQINSHPAQQWRRRWHSIERGALFSKIRQCLFCLFVFLFCLSFFLFVLVTKARLYSVFTGEQSGTSYQLRTPLCKTKFPGWLNGTVSVAESAMKRFVCFSNSRGQYGRECCSFWRNISVPNCRKFLVYKLKRPPLCNLSYCGNGLPSTTPGENFTRC